MRLAFISDMHGNAVAFEEVIKDLDQQAPDAVICLGDVAQRGPESKKCVELLRSLDPLFTIRGNFDHMFTRLDVDNVVPEDSKDKLDLHAFQFASEQLSEEEMNWLAHLPTEEKRIFEGVQFEFYHATPHSLHEKLWPWATDEELAALFTDDATKISVFGHMHRSFIRYLDGKTVINTGSIGLPFDGDDRASYAIVDLENGNVSTQLRRIPYDIKKAIQVARDLNMPDVWAFEYALRYARYPYHLTSEKIHS